MTTYGSLRNNYYGEYVDDPKGFISDILLDIGVSYTVKAYADLILDGAGVETVNFQDVTNAKFIIISCDDPIYAVFNGGAEQLVVDPLLIVSNQGEEAGAYTALTVQRIGTENVNVKVRVLA